MLRSREIVLVGMLALALVAGCVRDDPEESADAGGDDGLGPVYADEPAAPAPAPADDGVSDASSRIVESGDAPASDAAGATAPAPGPDPPAVPPAAPAPAPAPGPAPAAAPAAPSPAPAPSPASSPTPTPSASPPTPPPPPPPPPPAWPREGSYVSYSTRTSQSFAGSDQQWKTYANATWTYHDGDWRGECRSTTYDDSDGDGNITIVNETTTYSAATPPHWPLFDTRSPPAEGELVDTWYLRGCTIEKDEWYFRGADTHEGVATYLASSNPDEPPYDFKTEWSQESGLVLYWSKYRFMTSAPFSTVGELTSTDAPMS